MAQYYSIENPLERSHHGILELLLDSLRLSQVDGFNKEDALVGGILQ